MLDCFEKVCGFPKEGYQFKNGKDEKSDCNDCDQRFKSIFLIFNSPYKHEEHHSNGKYGNYASMFPFWDNIMNTNI